MQLDDPVKKRRIYSEYLKKILDRIGTVVADEKAALSSQLETLRKYINLEDLNEASEIEEVVKQIGKFYSQAQISHVSIAVHYDLTKISKCKKNAVLILSAIRNVLQIIEIQNPIEALIRLSRDPMQALKPFTELLSITDSDIQKANSEVERRMQNKVERIDEARVTKYLVEEKQLNECQTIISEVKKKHVNG